MPESYEDHMAQVASERAETLAAGCLVTVYLPNGNVRVGTYERDTYREGNKRWYCLVRFDDGHLRLYPRKWIER